MEQGRRKHPDIGQAKFMTFNTISNGLLKNHYKEQNLLSACVLIEYLIVLLECIDLFNLVGKVMDGFARHSLGCTTGFNKF